jgi:ABC-type uncharacterized transport system ATPase subunit
MTPILELKNITKSFPGVLANDHIDLTLINGEIHALLGENGAGKTTLMNILYGLYNQDEGDIIVNGEIKEIISPINAIEAGIGMVHQHFMLIPVFTVTENVMLGDESLLPKKISEKQRLIYAVILGVVTLLIQLIRVLTGGATGQSLVAAAMLAVVLSATAWLLINWLDRKSSAKRIREISEQYNLEVDPEAYVNDLPVGVQQRVEIIKLLYREANILVFDEPTAVLTPQEADGLFDVMRSLVKQGNSIIFITHKLKEVLQVADRITVLRNGKVVGSTTPEEANEAKLASMMVGREVMLQVDKNPAKTQDVVLKVNDLQVLDDRNQMVVDNVSFDVRAGEILGVAGVQGNGQTELVEALTGLRKVYAGQINILGKNTSDFSPRQITELGTSHIPEDRQRDGLVLTYPIIDNLALNTYYLPPFSKGVALQYQEMTRSAETLVNRFDIRTPSVATKVGSLSGGNQQKVIVAREFSRPTHLMIASQPTRGLDVGSIEYIHQRLVEKRDEGTAVLLVSSELDEIMQLSDRIAVMYRGQIIDTLDAKSVTKEKVGLLMAGISNASAETVSEG